MKVKSANAFVIPTSLACSTFVLDGTSFLFRSPIIGDTRITLGSRVTATPPSYIDIDATAPALNLNFHDDPPVKSQIKGVLLALP